MKPKEFIAYLSAPDPINLEQGFRIDFGVTYIRIMIPVTGGVLKWSVSELTVVHDYFPGAYETSETRVFPQFNRPNYAVPAAFDSHTVPFYDLA